MDIDLSLLEPYLHHQTLGSYRTHLALISLAPQASFWSEGNEPTLDRWAVFAHEYAHFLHNFSTISGLWDFVVHLRLAGLFIRTVGADGTSHGMDVLDEPERLDFGKWHRLRQHLSGTRYPFDPDYHRRDVQISISGHEKVPASLSFSTQDFPVDLESTQVSFEVWSASTPKELRTLIFGSWHIMEALAYEIERTIFKANGADVAALDSTVDSYPYKFGRHLFEDVARTIPSEAVFSRVCVMALQSTDPGTAFVDIAKVFRKRPLSEPDAVTLKRLEIDTLQELRQKATTIVNQTLRPEFERFASRGTIGPALATLGDMAYKYVDLRTKDLFFELTLFEQPLDRDRLRQLLQSYPPCPIVHKTTLNGISDLFNISLTELSPEALDALCAYQTFSQFMLAHFQPAGFRRTAECPPSQCIFFGACTAYQATHTPELCQTQPWRSFVQNDGTICLYAAGVSTSRGRADL